MPVYDPQGDPQGTIFDRAKTDIPPVGTNQSPARQGGFMDRLGDFARDVTPLLYQGGALVEAIKGVPMYQRRFAGARQGVELDMIARSLGFDSARALMEFQRAGQQPPQKETENMPDSSSESDAQTTPNLELIKSVIRSGYTGGSPTVNQEIGALLSSPGYQPPTAGQQQGTDERTGSPTDLDPYSQEALDALDDFDSTGILPDPLSGRRNPDIPLGPPLGVDPMSMPLGTRIN